MTKNYNLDSSSTQKNKKLNIQLLRRVVREGIGLFLYRLGYSWNIIVWNEELSICWITGPDNENENENDKKIHALDWLNCSTQNLPMLIHWVDI